MTVSWTPPDFDGGTPIISYLVEYKGMSTSEWAKVNVEESMNTYIVQGLVTRTKYHFRVSARNEVGSSKPSILSEVYETLGKLIFSLQSNFYFHKKILLLLSCLKKQTHQTLFDKT